MLFFATYSTGYKSAGYNSGAGSPSLTTVGNPPVVFRPERRVFDRETTENWELGAKTSWLDRKLTAEPHLLPDGHRRLPGPRVRRHQLHRPQCRQSAPPGLRVRWRRQAVRNLSAFAGRRLPGFRIHRLSECGRTCPGLRAATQDLKGKPATFAPKWSGRVGFDWTGDFGSSGCSWDLNSNLSFVSKQYGGLVNDANPQTIIDGYALLGARVTLNGPGDRWSVSLFGNNLTNKQYEAGNLYQFLDGSLGLRNGVFPGKHRRPAPARRSAHLRRVGHVPLLNPSEEDRGHGIPPAPWPLLFPEGSDPAGFDRGERDAGNEGGLHHHQRHRLPARGGNVRKPGLEAQCGDGADQQKAGCAIADIPDRVRQR